MNDYNKIYKYWTSKALEAGDLINELESIKDNENDIKERFALNLEFGTAGLRGIIGAGTNRMNIYVVRKSTLGFYMPWSFIITKIFTHNFCKFSFLSV